MNRTIQMMKQRCALVVMLLVMLSQSVRLWAASEPYARLSTDCTTLTFYDNEGKTTDDYSLPTSNAMPGWANNSATVTTVVFDKSFAAARPTTCQAWFQGMSSLTTISGIENLNTSEVTSMLNMFNGCSRLTQLNLSSFDTGNVTHMTSMFNGCSSLSSLDLSSFNTSKVTSMAMMFAGCEQLSSVNLTSFDTQQVNEMDMMFKGCKKLTEIDLTSFNTKNVLSTAEMFASCEQLQRIKASNHLVMTKVSYSQDMFTGCTSLQGAVAYDSEKTDAQMAQASTGYLTLVARTYVQYADGTLTFSNDANYALGFYLLPSDASEAPHWLDHADDVTKVVFDDSFREVRPTSCALWFRKMTHLTTIEGMENLNTSEVTTMRSMFEGCKQLTAIDLSGFVTDKVTDMRMMFNSCEQLTELDLSGFNTSAVTQMSEMFAYCTSLQKLNISSFDTHAVTSMLGMFAYCASLTSLDVTGMVTDGVTDMSAMFQGCKALTSIDLTSFHTDKVTLMSEMFDGCAALTRIDVSKRFVTTNVTESNGMFSHCSSLQGAVPFDSEKTDAQMAQWETGYLTLLSIPYVHYADSTLTFAYDTYYELSDICVDLNSQIVDDAPAWVTAYGADVTKVVIDESFAQARPTSTFGWFANMDHLKAIEGLEHLNTSKTNNMSGMFYGCEKLTQLNLSGFVTDNVTNMEAMFGDCHSLQELNLSSFRTSKVTSMSWMFFGCEKLTQLDLSSFSTESVTNMESMFAACASLQELDLSGFRNTNTTDMSHLFQGCEKLSKLNLYGFRTDKVTDMRSMFKGCSSLKELDLASIYTRYVKYADEMFSGCSELTTILVSCDFATDAIIQSDDMFGGCTKLVGAVPFDSEKTDAQMANTTSGYLTMPSRAYVYKYHGTMTFYYDDDYDSSDYILPTNEHQAPGWLEYQNDIKEVTFHYSFTEARPTSCYKWFYHMPNLTTIEGLTYLNASHVTTMEDMFNGCRSLKRLTMLGVNTDIVESLKGMFASCDSIETLDLAGLNTAVVKDMSEMFSGCSSLKRVDVSRGFVTKSVTQSGDMFQGCTQLVGAVPFDSAKTDAQMANWTTGYLTLPSHIYAQYADSTLTIYYGDDNDATSYYTPIDLERELPGWHNVAKDITKVVIDKSVAQARPKSTFGWFYEMIKLKDIEGLAYINTSCVTNMMGMFLACSSITALDLSTFQTDSVTDMSLMFAQCNALQKLNLSSFHTDKVKNMSGMFDECESLQELDLSSFRTDKVTLMDEMFSACRSLQELDLSSFNTEAVNNMNLMFSYCGKLKRIDVSRSFVTTNCASSQKVFMFCNELVGAVAYDSNKQLIDMVQWETGYLTLKVGTNGEDNIGAVGSPLTITNLPLADDKAFDLYEECPTSLASYSRTVKNHWATLCLPFAFSAEGNSSARFYSVGQYDNDNISVTELSGTIAAGTPVLVYVSGNELSITAEDVDVVAQPANNTADVLQGVFTQTEVADDDYIIANDHFWNALYLKQQNPDAKHVYVAPYRAYLTLANLSEASKPNSISINDDVTDGIGGIASADGMEDLLDGAELYDLQGRRLTAPQRGVIIVRKGGVSRKVVVR